MNRFIGKASALIGLGLASAPASGMADTAAVAMPMVQFMILMAIVIGMPFIIVFSGYGPKAVGLLTFAYFGTVTLSFWFELSRWLQNHLIEMAYGGGQPHNMYTILFQGHVMDKQVLGLVNAVMLIFLPAIWMAMLGWAGYNVGGAVGSALTRGSEKANEAGEKGAKTAQDVATKKGTKGGK